MFKEVTEKVILSCSRKERKKEVRKETSRAILKSRKNEITS